MIMPSWFKYRQGKAEEAGEKTYRLYGPNLPDAFVGLRQTDDGRWQGFLKDTADGEDVSVTDPHDSEYNAWEVTFEMYRQAVIV